MADADLQDEPLQLRVMDYDTYSANDLIGKVYFNLNPLLVNSTSEIRNNAKSSLSVSPGTCEQILDNANSRKISNS